MERDNKSLPELRFDLEKHNWEDRTANAHFFFFFTTNKDVRGSYLKLCLTRYCGEFSSEMSVIKVAGNLEAISKSRILREKRAKGFPVSRDHRKELGFCCFAR